MDNRELTEAFRKELKTKIPYLKFVISKTNDDSQVVCMANLFCQNRYVGTINYFRYHPRYSVVRWVQDESVLGSKTTDSLDEAIKFITYL